VVVYHNISAINAQRQMFKTSTAQAKATEKLSSGLRINRAGDDAAGLAISEKMRGQISGLNQASRNAQDAISLIQTAEGALDEQQSMMQRMRELCVQAENDTNTADDRQQLQNEIDQLIEEITAITQKTEFNTKKLLDGSQRFVSASADAYYSNGKERFSLIASLLKEYDEAKKIGSIDWQKEVAGYVGKQREECWSVLSEANKAYSTARVGGITFQVGANAGQTITVGIQALTAEDLYINKISVLYPRSGYASEKGGLEYFDNFTLLDKALTKVSIQRSQLGAVQNRLEHTIASVDNAAENLQAAESRIRDTDMAKEMMALTAKNVLAQATQAMLAQANLKPSQVLSLLQ
jgi:flagellin